MEGSGNGSTEMSEYPSHLFHMYETRYTGHACANWIPARLFAEVFLIVLLCENCLFGVVILTTNAKSSFHGFFNKLCIIIITSSGIGLCLHLCLFPFLFASMTEDENIHEASTTQPSSTTIFSSSNGFLLKKTSCFWLTTHACKWSGITHSLFAYTPLAVIVAMNIDRVIATFCWKFYKFRKHAVSAFRLTILFGFLATFCFVLLIPFLDIGANFEYESFLMVCVLPRTPSSKMTMNFAYIVHAFSLLLLSILITAGCLVAVAIYLHSKDHDDIGHFRSSLVCGQCGVVKSQAWLAVSRSTLAITGAGILVYLPLTVLSFLRLFNSSQTQSTASPWDIATDVLIILMTFIGPILNTWFHKPYRLRTWQILNLIRRKRDIISPDPHEYLDSDGHSSDEHGHNIRRSFRQHGRDIIRVVPQERNPGIVSESSQHVTRGPIQDGDDELSRSRDGHDEQSVSLWENRRISNPRHSSGRISVLESGIVPAVTLELPSDHSYENILYKMRKDDGDVRNDTPKRSQRQSSRDANPGAESRRTSGEKRRNRVLPSSSGSGSSVSRLDSESTSIKTVLSSAESTHTRHLQEAIEVGENEAIQFYRKASRHFAAQYPTRGSNESSLFYGHHSIYPPEYHYHHHFHVYDSPRQARRRSQELSRKPKRREDFPDAGPIIKAPIHCALRGSQDIKDISRQNNRGNDRIEKYRRSKTDKKISAKEAGDHAWRCADLDGQLSEDQLQEFPHRGYSKNFSLDFS